MRFYKDIILPSGILSGTIIGAGIFSLPFIFNEAGFLTGMLYLVIFGAVLSVVYLMHADTIIVTPGEHNYVGYARIYLGEFGFWIALVVAILAMVLSLVAYLVLSVSFISLFIPAGAVLIKVLAFWFLGSLALFLRVRGVAISETIITGAIVAIIALIFALGAHQLNGELPAILTSFHPVYLFLPFGPILFAFSGRNAIPSMIEYFRDEGRPARFVKKPIILGALLPILVYALFVVGVLGLSPEVTTDSVTGIIESVPTWMLAVVGFLGFISLFSSYLVIGHNVRDILEKDLRAREWLADSIVIFIPLLLYFAGFKNFLAIVALAGGVFLALDNILVVLMWWRSRKRYLSQILKGVAPVLGAAFIILFLIGALSKILYH